MAPEDLNGEGYDKRVDIWALGCILYEMMTGSLAFDSDNFLGLMLNIVGTNPLTPASNYLPAWKDMVMCMIEKYPDSRPDFHEIWCKLFADRPNSVSVQSNKPSPPPAAPHPTEPVSSPNSPPCTLR